MNSTLDFRFELKELGAREFEGYGSTFGNLDLGGDIVMPGAFTKTLESHRENGELPGMFWMHNPSSVAGVWLDMQEDEKGLFVRGRLADTTLGRDLHTLLQMKAVRGLSIGYQTRNDDFDRRGNRLLKEIDLWEVSLVSLRMNPLATIDAAKSTARLSHDGEYVPTEREFEARLREVGCSKSVAKFLVAKIFDDDPGGKLDGHWRDAGKVDGEAVGVLDSIASLADQFTAEVFRTR